MLENVPSACPPRPDDRSPEPQDDPVVSLCVSLTVPESANSSTAKNRHARGRDSVKFMVVNSSVKPVNKKNPISISMGKRSVGSVFDWGREVSLVHQRRSHGGIDCLDREGTQRTVPDSAEQPNRNHGFSW